MKALPTEPEEIDVFIEALRYAARSKRKSLSGCYVEQWDFWLPTILCIRYSLPVILKIKMKIYKQQRISIGVTTSRLKNCFYKSVFCQKKEA